MRPVNSRFGIGRDCTSLFLPVLILVSLRRARRRGHRIRRHITRLERASRCGVRERPPRTVSSEPGSPSRNTQNFVTYRRDVEISPDYWAEMLPDHPYYELANWDGSLSHSSTPTPTSTSTQKQPELGEDSTMAKQLGADGSMREHARDVGDEVVDKMLVDVNARSMLPPPSAHRPPLSRWAETHGASLHVGSDRGASFNGSTPSSDSAYPDSEDERRNVASMLLAPVTPSSPDKVRNGRLSI